MQILIKNNSSCRDQENNGPEFILRYRYCLVWRMCLEQGCRSLFYPIFNIWNVFNPVLVFLQHWMIFQCLWILISRHQSMTRNKRLQCCNKDQIGPSQLLTKIWQWYIKYACFISIINLARFYRVHAIYTLLTSDPTRYIPPLSSRTFCIESRKFGSVLEMNSSI